jgi:hypothetical protein
VDLRSSDEGNLMNKGFELVRIRADDYIADLLEREASLVPPGFEGNAEVLRQQAKFFRESTRTETMTIWKPVAE